LSQVTTLDASFAETADRPDDREVPALAVVWSASDPQRVGEVLVPRADGEPVAFGRGDPVLVRQRPGRDEPTQALDNPFLSRRHFTARSEGDALVIENFGKRPLLHEGSAADSELVVRPGETVEIEKQLVFACVLRPRAIPATQLAIGTFGEPDAHGITGESPRVWELREQLAMVGALSAHVLLLGASGTGKELAAQAIHAQSARRARAIVARNAATFPSGLIDAELFGNVAGYPNAGMPERAGVIGEADGGTLFLDEVAELPLELQSHLLRVLDEAGEYSRLGDAKRRRADLRVIAATNRGADSLKHDLAARLGLRVVLPGLEERREDIPLIARALLRRRARKDAPIGARYFASWDGTHGEPRLSPALARALVTHTYTTHARELDSFLLRALVGSRGSTLELTDELAAEMRPVPRTPARAYTAEQIRSALAKHDGVREKAWRELGMPNRYVLKRLMKKFNIAGADD
jgi:two-component system nitrogen regulation response regulator GlnG/two-component system response regulator HydG